MYHVVAATHNPAKLSAIKQAFFEVFAQVCHIEPVTVNSGVPDQPLGCEQTRLGARTRLHNARIRQPDADFWLAIEAGFDDNSTFSWVVIENANKYSQVRSASLPLPPCVIAKIMHGNTLEQAICALTGVSQTGQQQGAISLLTGGKLTRSRVYQQAVILALSPFCHPLYDDGLSNT